MVRRHAHRPDVPERTVNPVQFADVALMLYDLGAAVVLTFGSIAVLIAYRRTKL